jgi:hypothetical protein
MFPQGQEIGILAFLAWLYYSQPISYEKSPSLLFRGDPRKMTLNKSGALENKVFQG